MKVWFALCSLVILLSAHPALAERPHAGPGMAGRGPAGSWPPGRLLERLIDPCRAACHNTARDCHDTAETDTLTCIQDTCAAEVRTAKSACADDRTSTACQQAVQALRSCGQSCFRTTPMLLPERSAPLSRRTALRLLGAMGLVTLLGCGDEDDDASTASIVSATTATSAGSASCLLTPTLTEGPYFVDERLNRADITGGQTGVPLRLNISVYRATTSVCSLLPGVQIDVWHANGLGAYSDIAALGTTGQTFLRGYQVTDANGLASFTTLYPGWYMGRATHIHLKARIFNAAGNVTLEATTQLFFDDNVTDIVYASTAPYNTRGARDTRNAQDNIYNGNSNLVLALSGSSTTGYVGTMSIVIAA